MGKGIMSNVNATYQQRMHRIVSKGSYNEKDAAVTVKTLSAALGYLHAKKVPGLKSKTWSRWYVDTQRNVSVLVAAVSGTF